MQESGHTVGLHQRYRIDGLSRSLFIRTVTVGSGIAPDLLTLAVGPGARGLGKGHYRRWGIAPRPENATGLNGRSGKFTLK